MVKKGTKKVKKLEEYKETKPEQLRLFEGLLPEDREYSNTIEFYDFIPKYFWGRAKRIEDKFLPTLKRDFEVDGVKYSVEIEPARITDNKGVDREYYPSKREELVEDALRKLAVEGQGTFLDDEAAVKFSLYQLQKELKNLGHTYSKTQIKEALLICAKTKLSVKTSDGKNLLISSIFETLGLQTREDWKGTGKKTRAYVRFNSLITKAIKQKMFRQYNYEISMSYKTVIARQLHKRMSHRYKQAHKDEPYTIGLNTIIRDFGLTRYKRLPDNLRDVQNALDEMKKKKIIKSYKSEKIFDTKRHNKLVDAKFVITPDEQFVQDTIKANQRNNQIQVLRISA